MSIAEANCIRLVNNDPCTGCLFDLLNTKDMIEMAVSQEDIFNFKIVLIYKPDYAVRISARIYNRSLTCVSVENYIAIFTV